MAISRPQSAKVFNALGKIDALATKPALDKNSGKISGQARFTKLCSFDHHAREAWW